MDMYLLMLVAYTNNAVKKTQGTVIKLKINP